MTPLTDPHPILPKSPTSGPSGIMLDSHNLKTFRSDTVLELTLMVGLQFQTINRKAEPPGCRNPSSSTIPIINRHSSISIFILVSNPEPVLISEFDVTDEIIEMEAVHWILRVMQK